MNSAAFGSPRGIVLSPPSLLHLNLNFCSNFPVFDIEWRTINSLSVVGKKFQNASNRLRVLF